MALGNQACFAKPCCGSTWAKLSNLIARKFKLPQNHGLTLDAAARDSNRTVGQ